MCVIKVFQVDRMFTNKQHDNSLQFGTVFYRIKFGDGFYMGEERDYLFGHLLAGESQVDYVLQEGEEDEGGGY